MSKTLKVLVWPSRSHIVDSHPAYGKPEGLLTTNVTDDHVPFAPTVWGHSDACRCPCLRALGVLFEYQRKGRSSSI